MFYEYIVCTYILFYSVQRFAALEETYCKKKLMYKLLECEEF